ncbi:MAG: type IV secretory system conjugative DNA transfer family protein [Ottowia sp.]|nr:type IV secretory system conjugative DNA transfer family protein [Ottowia sp.]
MMMKYFPRFIALVCSALSCVGAYAEIYQGGDSKTLTSLQASTDTSATTLDALMRPVSTASTGVADLRIQMLIDAGKTIGFRGGLIDRARGLIAALKIRSDSLDKIFQFSTLLNKNGTIPPVIVEAQDISSFSADQIRMASRVYKIEKEERFVSVPPTWRDYLFVGLPVNGAVDLPPLEARPQNSSEQTIWQDAVKSGWNEGRNQADAILAANFNRLTRDYTGMMRYSTLLQQGMISATKTAETQQTVTGDGKQLTLGDTFRRLISKAVFEPDAKKWRPTISKALMPDPAYPPLDNFAARWRVLGLGAFSVSSVHCDGVATGLANHALFDTHGWCLNKNSTQALFELPRLWVLSKDKTLKENLTDWANTAGWNPPIWDADNPYQIASTSSLNGTFVEVLERVFQSVPDLDIHVWKGPRNIRVSDRKK